MAGAHLEQREGRVEQRLTHRRVEQAKEGALRADADVERCVRVHARLRVARGRRGDGNASRGIEVHEYVRGGQATEGCQSEFELRDEVARYLKCGAHVRVAGEGHRS